MNPPKLVLTALLLCTMGAAEAQSPATQWERVLGGSLHEAGRTVVPTNDGGYFMVGSSNSTDGQVSENNGDHDLWAVKVDADGLIEWQRSYGSSLTDAPAGAVVDPQGGYLIAAETWGDDGDVSGSHGATDVWLLHSDDNGSFSWQRCLGGSGWEMVRGLTNAADGGFLLTASTSSSDGDIMSGNNGDNDLWVVRLDADGELQWERTYGGSSTDDPIAIHGTTDGGCVVVGVTASGDGDVPGPRTSEDGWVLKLDADGDLLWQRVIGGSRMDTFTAAAELPSGEIFCAGFTDSPDGDVMGWHGETTAEEEPRMDYWGVKLSSEGDLLWSRAYGGFANDIAWGVCAGHDDRILLVGETNSSGGDVSGYLGGNDLWVSALDATGAIVWQQCYGGADRDEGRSIHPTTDGGYILTGVSHSNTGPLNDHHGGADLYLLKLAPQGTGVMDASGPVLEFRAVPQRGALLVSTSGSVGHANVVMTDMNGRTVLQGRFTGDQELFDTHHLASGTYAVSLITADTRRTIKVFLE